MSNKLSTRSLVTMALFAAVLSVSAYISIPLPTGSHITFLNFVVMLVALVFPASESLIIIAVWMLLGIVGVPVFIGGNAGISYLIGAWGGYSFAFLVIGFLLPLIRGKEYHRIRFTICAILSAVVVDLIGAIWLMVLTSLSIKKMFVIGFLPFIPLDLVKAIVVAQIVPQFRKIIAGSESN